MAMLNQYLAVLFLSPTSVIALVDSIIEPKDWLVYSTYIPSHTVSTSHWWFNFTYNEDHNHFSAVPGTRGIGLHLFIFVPFHADSVQHSKESLHRNNYRYLCTCCTANPYPQRRKRRFLSCIERDTITYQ